MARRVKIEPSVLRQKKRQEKKRLQNIRAKRTYYLIVCEGEKTEPNYFKSLTSAFPKGILQFVEFTIKGDGYNTESLVNNAILLKESLSKSPGSVIDKLWVVFDKDSFPAEKFNNAINKCNATPNTMAAWSNEAFELWYLLHFEYYDTGISRESYKKRIEHHFRSKGLTNFQYTKNREDMFRLLLEYGSVDTAIKNARKLKKEYAGAKDFSHHNPCTTVYRLVIELKDLQEQMFKEINQKSS